MIRGAYPALLAVLALIHAQAPLGDRLLGCAEITARSRAIRLGDGCQGWPVKSLAEGRAMGYVRFLQATFMPSDWLLALYYGIKNEQMIPLFRWIIHPFELGRIALYRLWLRPQRKKLSGNVSRTD
jgi:hypothetical protein